MKDLPGQRAMWGDQPPSMDESLEWRLHRCGPNKPWKMRVLSRKLVGCYTHFFGGRTRPCPGVTTCEACAIGQRPRWLGYIAATNVDGGGKGLIEIPAGACNTIAEYYREHKNLRGCILTLKRVSKKPNARVVCEIRSDGVDSRLLPEAPFIQQMLERMWEVRVVDDRTFEGVENEREDDESEGPGSIPMPA